VIRNTHALQRELTAARQAQRLYERYDSLSEACANLRWALEALRGCREDARQDDIAALEQIAAGLTRDRDIAHARLERLEAREQAQLRREAAGL